MGHETIVELKRECEKTFYKEIYHYDGTGNTLIIDETSRHLYMKKVLRVFHEEVFAWLKEHHDPCVPVIYDYYRQGDCLVVIEELISGRSLAEALEAGGPNLRERKRIILEIIRGLAFLHQASPPIIHRDLKPENVMLQEGGRVVLVDYDAARVYQENLTRDTVLMGTAGSAAPEQYGFAQSDERTDIYALGVLIREMVPEDPRWMRAADKATHMDPDRRFQNLRQMKRALGEEGSFPSVPPGFRTRTPWKMLTALAGYLFIGYVVFAPDERIAGRGPEGVVTQICMLMSLLMMVDLCTDWSPLFARLPFRQAEKQWVRVLGCGLGCVVILFAWALVNIVIGRLISG